MDTLKFKKDDIVRFKKEFCNYSSTCIIHTGELFRISETALTVTKEIQRLTTGEKIPWSTPLAYHLNSWFEPFT